MIRATWERDGVRLFLGDCLEVLPQLGAGVVDLVVTDPPYGIGYESGWRTANEAGTERKNRAVFGVDVFDDRWVGLAFAAQRAGFVYCFTRWDVMGLWRQALEREGYVVRQRLVWDKRHWGMGDLRYYGSQVEDVILASKGPVVLFEDGIGRRGNLFAQSRYFLREGQFDHPTQKPVDVLRQFVVDGSQAGQVVLDPFMGSGSTGVAAVREGRGFIGVEVDERFFEIAVRRVDEVMRQPRLLE